MASPFPGMDPYVEEPSIWPDCHAGLIAAMSADLNAHLPERYSAWKDRNVWVYEPDAQTRSRLKKPDVFVTEHARSGNGASGIGVLPAPATSVLPVIRREGNRFIRIIDRQSRRVVTGIELLSPANKDPHQDREAYLAKRNLYLASGTNLVEIDLLRDGERMPMGEPAPQSADYYVFICRASDFPSTAIWPLGVRDSLPPIPIPLNPEDDPVMLDLGACFTRAYDEAPYRKEIDYSQLPVPPLSDADAAWARELLARHQASLRKEQP
jgi:hypothetical protein